MLERFRPSPLASGKVTAGQRATSSRSPRLKGCFQCKTNSSAPLHQERRKERYLEKRERKTLAVGKVDAHLRRAPCTRWQAQPALRNDIRKERGASTPAS